VLVPFPFTDLGGQKTRPALIVSPDPVGEDILVAFVSSVIPPAPKANEYVLKATHPAFVSAQNPCGVLHFTRNSEGGVLGFSKKLSLSSSTGLKITSVFKMGKMATLHCSLILRRLGRTTPELQRTLDAVLERAVGLS